MTEALWAQLISGFFGLASLVLGTYLPYRLRQRSDDQPDTNEPNSNNRPNKPGPSAASEPEVSR
jgi:hypothetical protein